MQLLPATITFYCW